MVLGILSVVGSFQIYTRRYQQGGIICITAGLLALVVVQAVTDSIIVLLGGILGLLAATKG
jgi:hypothetical protein